jgi:mono/diheme cytochrome c family protein
MFLQAKFAVVVTVLAISILLSAQTSSSTQSAAGKPQRATKLTKIPASYTPPSSGKAMYTAYCTSCHGEAGRGDGPAVSALKVQPTNLTLLAAKNHGIFPDSTVAAVLRGDNAAPAHGSKEMPVWGPVFLHMSKQDTGQMQMRVHNLTLYLGSIQQK